MRKKSNIYPSLPLWNESLGMQILDEGKMSYYKIIPTKSISLYLISNVSTNITKKIWWRNPIQPRILPKALNPTEPLELAANFQRT